jgi:metacaspase-1
MKKAICIGINNYPGTGMDLSGCVNDAKDWAKMLKSRGFSVSTLLDDKATGAMMRKAFTNLIAQTKANDTIVVQYSGHGTYVPDKNGDEADGRDEALVPYDIMTNGPLIDDEIYSIFRKKATGSKIIFISDSCHSGTVLRAFGGCDVLEGMKKKFMPPRVFMKDTDLPLESHMVENISEDDVGFRDISGVLLLLAGCQDIQYSIDGIFGGRPNGAFTYFALKALAQMTSVATYSQWFKQIKTYLPSNDYDQTPNLYGVGMRSVIFA